MDIGASQRRFSVEPVESPVPGRALSERPLSEPTVPDEPEAAREVVVGTAPSSDDHREAPVSA